MHRADTLLLISVFMAAAAHCLCYEASALPLIGKSVMTSLLAAESRRFFGSHLKQRTSILKGVTGATSTLRLRSGDADDALLLATRVGREWMNPLSLWPDRFILACDGDEVVGFGQLRPQGRIWELASLVVEPSHRQQGVGSHIVKELLDRHRGSAYSGTPVYLITLESTCPFYERLGFCVAELAPSELRFELAAGAVLAQLARGEKLACMVWDAADNS